MLAFARKQELDARPVDVAALLAGMDDLVRRSIGPQIEIALDVEPATPAAMVDANQLEMAILNLAVNARDAMDGSGTLTIRLDAPDRAPAAGPAAGPDPGRYVRVAVEDTGSGMDAATLAQAMEPFFTTKGVGKGTGLGLSMVHGLAEQSGGAFRILSEPGRGTTAQIYLPVAEPMAPAAPEEEDADGDRDAPADAHPADTAAPAPRVARKILAVDDDALVLMGTVGLLEDLGHEVFEATSGEQALGVLRDHPDIDLVVTDHAMPNMTGVELARRIRDGGGQIPVVLATGYAEMPEGAECYIAARLEKPFSDRNLADTLARV